jgi:hypothetical protein
VSGTDLPDPGEQITRKDRPCFIENRDNAIGQANLASAPGARLARIWVSTTSTTCTCLVTIIRKLSLGAEFAAAPLRDVWKCIERMEWHWRGQPPLQSTSIS